MFCNFVPLPPLVCTDEGQAMRRFILLSLLVLVLLVIFVPEPSNPWDHSSNTNSGGLQRLITAIRDALYLFAELILDLLNRGWQATPPRYKVVYVLLFAGVGVLALLGLLSLRATRGLSRRLFG